MRLITARCRSDRSTKRLVRRLKRGEVAVIDHSDLDALAAGSLISKRPVAVLNARPSFTGRYPAPGPQMLAAAGIVIIDCLGNDALQSLTDGTVVRITGSRICVSGEVLADGRRLSLAAIRSELQSARRNLRREFTCFVANTLARADKEKSLFASTIDVPELKTSVRGRPAVIVVRGQWFASDLRSLLPYIREQRPVLVGVDGGADALLNSGLTADIIIGDMDSVSDEALRRATDIIVHAYHGTGHAPGLDRIRRLGLKSDTFACPGTSEDAALMLLFESDAELLVGVGTHRGVVDFLEKGRSGMASTLLVRMLVGSILVDANGVSHLYQPVMRWGDVVAIAGFGLLPLLALLFQGSAAAMLLQTLVLRARLFPY